MDFIKWVEEHSDEYGVKFVPLPDDPDEREKVVRQNKGIEWMRDVV